MPLLHLFILALIQGITEFLPISSSGHLILLPQLTGMEDQGQAIDVAVHLGTLVAVIAYFKSDVARALTGTAHLMTGKKHSQDAHLALGLIIATLPVILAGLVLKLTGLDDAMRSIKVIGWTMLLFGLLLYVADRIPKADKALEDWSLKQAFIFGLWQMIALIPGTSRSGICITGGRFMGYSREEAARIAMLMSIPTILAAGTLSSLDVIGEANWRMVQDGAIAAIFSGIAAWIALWVMMKLARRISFTPYVIYRVILGVILLALAYS